MKTKTLVTMMTAVLVLVISFAGCKPEEPAAPAPTPEVSKWAEGMHIRALIGGPAGGAFASLLQHGVEAARDDFGPKVDIIYSNWDSDLLLKQAREAIAIKPDGMVVNGIPGYDAMKLLARDMQAAGILFSVIVVDTGSVHKEFRGGYFGVADPYVQGANMAKKAVKDFGLGSGDRVLVMGAWDLDQHVREDGVAETFEQAGCTVDKITITHGQGGINSEPNLLTPILTAHQLTNPDTKLWSFQGGVTLGQAEMYMKAAGLQPGDVKMIGFDLNEQVIDGFEKGIIQIASDQQPFLIGYLSILNLVMNWKYGFSPFEVDTGTGLVDSSNYDIVAELSKQGIR